MPGAGIQRPTPGLPGGTCPRAEAFGPGGGEAAQDALPDPRTPLRSAPPGSGGPRACAQRGHTWRLFSARPGLAFRLPRGRSGRTFAPHPPHLRAPGPGRIANAAPGSAGTAASGGLPAPSLMEAEDRRRPEPLPLGRPPPSSASSRVTSFLQIPSRWCTAPARGWGGTRAVREPEPVTREARTCWRGRLVGSHLEMFVTREGLRCRRQLSEYLYRNLMEHLMVLSSPPPSPHHEKGGDGRRGASGLGVRGRARR